MLDYISYKMEPINIRFGIGLGEIYTDINYEISIGQMVQPFGMQDMLLNTFMIIIIMEIVR